MSASIYKSQIACAEEATHRFLARHDLIVGSVDLGQSGQFATTRTTPFATVGADIVGGLALYPR